MKSLRVIRVYQGVHRRIARQGTARRCLFIVLYCGAQVVVPDRGGRSDIG